MAFQSVPNTALVEILWNNGVSIVENTFYFRKDAPPYSLSDLTTLASSMALWAHTSMKPLVAATYTFLRAEVRGLHDENDNVVTNSTNTGPGTRAGTAVAPQTALAIARKSAFTGRTARGRIYTFGMVGADLTGPDKGELIAGYAAAWITALAALSAAGGNLGWTDVTVSRFLNKQKRATAVTFDVANYVAVDLRVDTRRGRI